MSDDDFDFGDDDFDDSFLQQVDDIAAQASLGKAIDQPAFASASTLLKASHQNARPAASTNTAGNAIPRTISRPSAAGLSNPRQQQPPPPSSDDFDDFHIPSDALDAIDTITTTAGSRNPNPVLRQSTFQRSSSGSSSNPRPAKPTAIPSSRLGMAARSSSGGGLQTHLNFRRENQSTKGKTWDRTAFAESGRRIVVPGKGKDKEKGYKSRGWAGEDDDDEEEEEEEDDFQPLVPPPMPFVDPHKPYDPQKHPVNAESAKTYIYPTNHPKRDYQFEIIQSAFTDNCLVALPTGLGKTFIAGVVMLNFYRWFPTGKIVFLAPTKPLVNQQIEACQMSCGIPSAAAAVMTGSSIPAAQRAKLWDAKRVFYCTPQTLDNDLKNGSVDPRDIVLAVFDEAHKASGHYAYTTILAYITAQNPYFRVLALTATPGSDVEKVQAVVDALHISRIEIREAEAPDISKYMNAKHTEQHTIIMTDVIADFRDRWADLMRPHVKKLVDANILNDRALDIKRLKPFTMTSKRMGLFKKKETMWAAGPLGQLEKMARAMGNLLEFSIGMFHTILSEFAGGLTASGKKSVSKGAAAALRNNYEFQKLVRDVDAEMNSIRMGARRRTKADKHPKMVKTLQLLLEHFSLAEEDEREHGVKNDTRAMVFCSYRECVLEIVDMLNEHSGLLKATKFVGQAQGKKEDDKGFKQKHQKQTIAEFKEGKFNVLVSTSIGEEGLDIGEVDFVVIYDMPKTSIKLLQRVGRTGRKRDGKVHVLMSEGREDTNWDSAQRNHRDIQEEILHSRNLELFDDVERLVPPGKLPICEERFMEVDPWDPEEGKTKKKLAAASRAEKANGDKKEKKEKKQRGHAIPEGGHLGFKSVAELVREQSSGKNAAWSEPEESEEEEDLDEMFAAMAGGAKKRGRGGTVEEEDDESPEPVVKKKKTVTKKARARVESEEPNGDLGAIVVTGNLAKGKAKALAMAQAKPMARKKPAPVEKDGDEEMAEVVARPKAAARRKGKDKGGKAAQSTEKEDEDVVEEVTKPKPKAKGKRAAKEKAVQDEGDEVIDLIDRPKAKSKTRMTKAKKAEEERLRLEAERVEVDDGEETLEDPVPVQMPPALDFLGVAPVPRRRGLTPTSPTPPSSPVIRGRSQVVPRSPSPRSDGSEDIFDLPGTRSASKQAEGGVPAALGPPAKLATTVDAPVLPPSLEVPRDAPNGSAGNMRLSPTVAAMAGFSQIPAVDMSWEDDLMSSPPPPPSAQQPLPKSTPAVSNPASTPAMPLPSSGIIGSGAVPGRRRIMGISRPKNSPAPARSTHDHMPPPPVPARSSPIVSPLAATQFPVRRAGKRTVALPSSEDTPDCASANTSRHRELVEASPVQVAGRLRRRKDASPGAVGGRSRRTAAGRRMAGRFLDLDAEKSGSEGSSDEPSSDVETESDRQFAGLDFQPTQAPRGYNQRAAYVSGLSTQMASKNGLNFGRNGNGNGSRHDTTGWLAKARKPILLSDDEGANGRSSENEYEMGSFVCEDEELDYDSQDGSDPLDSQR